MSNIVSKNSNGKSKVISLKPHSTIFVELKSQQNVEQIDTLKGVRRRYSVPAKPVLTVLTRKEYFYADDAWIQQDTLYAYSACYSCNLLKIPIDSIERAVIDFNQIVRKRKTKKGVWFTPSYASEINGLSLSLATTNHLTDMDTTTINGMNLGIELQWSLVALVAAEVAMLAPFYAVDFLFKKKDSAEKIKPTHHPDDCNRKCLSPDSSTIIINGIHLGILGSPFESNTIQGVNISGIGTFSNDLQGVSVSGLVTISDNFEGLCVSGLVNRSKRGRGLQIGLTNFATDYKGIQIGLWNKIGKLGFPFINLRFSKKKE
jgi:hypothetical protein